MPDKTGVNESTVIPSVETDGSGETNTESCTVELSLNVKPNDYAK